MRRAPRSALLVLAACSAGGAKEQAEPGPLEGESHSVSIPVPADAQPPAVEESAAPAQPAAPREMVLRDLVAEAGRAELHMGGLFIDMGTLDQHKYSRGGWLSGWGRNELAEDTSVAALSESRAWLDVVVDEPIKAVYVRARSPKRKGRLGLGIDKSGMTNTTIGSDFELFRVVEPKGLAPGRHRLFFSGRGMQIDWLWLATELKDQNPEPEARASADALLAPTPRRYRYYLVPESGAELRFEPVGQGAQASVTLAVDGAAATTLWQGAGGAGEVRVDLSAHAGKAVRLDFASTTGSVEWKRARLVRSNPAPVFVGNKKAKNLIVLLIDTVRADVFAPIAGDQAIGATAYDGLAAKSTVFPNAYNNENWTKPSIATIDTGMYPTSHGARWRKDRCSSDLVFLSEHLKEQGFATAAYVSNISAGPKFGFDQGWDSFTKTEDAEHAFGKADEWLEGRDPNKRFFLYVQTIDPHVPFVVPQGSTAPFYDGEYKGTLGPTFEQSEEDALNDGKLTLNDDDTKWLRALYNAEVMHHDKYLGIFLERLAERGLFEDTAFVILNDHGEEFGELGRWGHGWTMGDALYRSPLLMHLPGVFPDKRVEEVVEHVDVAPTLVDLLGVPALETAQGQSLMPLIRGEEVVERQPFSALLFGRPKKRAIRVGRHKLIVEGTHKASLFDVVADPDQQQDLLEQRPIARRLLEHALGEALANPNKAQRRADRSELPTIRAEYIAE